MFTSLFTLLRSDGVHQEAAGGILGDAVKAGTSRMLGAVSGPVRKKLREAHVQERLATALQRALEAALQATSSPPDAAGQVQLADRLRAWFDDEDVGNELQKLLDPRRADPLNLELLSERFGALAGDPKKLGFETDVPAFVSWLAGCLEAEVKADEVLAPLLEVSDLEKLVREAAGQSKLLEQLQSSAARSAWVLARLEERATTAESDQREQLEQLRLLLDSNRTLGRAAKATRRNSKKIADVVTREADERRTERRRTLEQYLRSVKMDCSGLPLQGVDPRTSDAETTGGPLELQGIYIALDTTYMVKQAAQEGARAETAQAEKSRPLPALEALGRTPRMVLLGAPGSGKSTFVRHVSLSLAAWQLENDPALRALWRLPTRAWPAKRMDLVPVTVVLRDLSAWGLDRWKSEATPAEWTGRFWEWLSIRCRSLAGADCFEHIRAALHDGRAILLWDGLDEIPLEQDRIRHIKLLIEAVATALPKSSMLVTCRVLSWQDPRWKLSEGWSNFELASLRLDQIDDFIGRWYRQLEVRGQTTEPERKAAKLREAVRRPALARLAPNPLLLTVMAWLHSYKGELPDARVELYEQTVELLLMRWDVTKGEGLDAGRKLQAWLEQAGKSSEDLKRLLSRLAFEAHARADARTEEEATADIAESDLKAALAGLHPAESGSWAKQGIRLMQERSGLLVENPTGVYRFPHRTFQEFLAARHLLAQGISGPQLGVMADAGTYWWEVIRLAVSRSAWVSMPLQGREMVIELAESVSDPPVTDAEWRRVWLAGECLLELGAWVDENAAARNLRTRIAKLLVVLLEVGALEPRERAQAGLVLGRLGDLRLGLHREDRWVMIEPGSLILRDEDVPENAEVREAAISYPYRISRFQVTNQEYQQFIHERGYEDRRWWSEGGWEWRHLNGDALIAHLSTLNLPRGVSRATYLSPGNVPASWGDPRHNAPNQAVVGVTVWEAEAYGRWLTARWHSTSRHPSWWSHDLLLRLPTELEWLRAARGSTGRPYPWGDTLRPSLDWRYSDNETGPAIVGSFPLGATPEGVLDLGGAVSELCLNALGPDDWMIQILNERKQVCVSDAWVRYHLILGGHWFLSNRRNTHRDTRVAGIRFSDVGFRLVCAPSTALDSAES